MSGLKDLRDQEARYHAALNNAGHAVPSKTRDRWGRKLERARSGIRAIKNPPKPQTLFREMTP